MAKNDMSISTMAAKQDTLALRIDAELKQRLMALARSRGVSVSALVLMTLTEKYPGLTQERAEAADLHNETLSADELDRAELADDD